jgi:hypothetical protein
MRNRFRTQVVLKKIMVSPNEYCLNNETFHPAAKQTTRLPDKKRERLNTLQTHVTEEFIFSTDVKKIQSERFYY